MTMKNPPKLSIKLQMEARVGLFFARREDYSGPEAARREELRFSPQWRPWTYLPKLGWRHKPL